MPVLVGGLVMAAGLGLTVPVPPAAAGETVRLSLPAPSGRHHVGTISLHLVDGGRTDPLAPTARARELIVRLWYPATRSGQVARYMPPRQADVLVQQLNAGIGAEFPADLLTFPTHARQDEPAARGPRRPVLLFSPALGTNAVLYTALLEELASRGYVVAGIEHTFDAAAVEFPDGRVETQNPDTAENADLSLPVRIADTRFVLDRLESLSAGHNPDADHRRLPDGLGRILDRTRVAAFGHSLGSRTVAHTIEADARFDTGAALDGGPLLPASVDRPFLMLGNPTHRRAEDPDWAGFYDRIGGRPRLHLVVDGAGHYDFSDITIFKKSLDLGSLFAVGPIDGERAFTIQRRYLTAWLDRTLHGRPSPLLRGESPRFPEVDFQP